MKQPTEKEIEEAKQLLGSGCLTIIILIIIGVIFYECHYKSNKPLNTIGAPTVIALNLKDEYDQNAVRAADKYKGRTVYVCGNISTIGDDIGGNAYIVLDRSFQASFIDSRREWVSKKEIGEYVCLICEIGRKILLIQGSRCE